MSSIYLKNVVTLSLKEEMCSGCGRCLEVCPHNVFAMLNKRAAIVQRDACMECGACARNCAWDAISVQAGVGCAAALLHAKLHKTSIECGCSTVECQG